MVARREAFLTDYQDADYAKRYRAMIDRVRAAEALLGSQSLTEAQSLTETVARSLFKLMAYKDEYEVARLHMETGFLQKLREEFEGVSGGEFKVNYHLAPPFLPLGKDARGRPRKRQFGQWMQVPFRVLARLKRLRGTRFDPFGYSAERRQERALIPWFEDIVSHLLARLDRDRLADAVAIAGLAMDIRGYGPVKDEAVVKVKGEIARRMAALG
jgi:indolepyruvate ferredoxin oxidoreductase